jgi:hypothetical protein
LCSAQPPCPRSFNACCTCNFSITARCKLDFAFFFDIVGVGVIEFDLEFVDVEDVDIIEFSSAGLVEAVPDPERVLPLVGSKSPLERRFGGTMIGVARGGGGHWIVEGEEC